ncbi:MAG: prepilin-type N-terminal cleavage/methylation domain-containing protein [Desulfuromonas sp.]|nr:prepilin-type N-terminal cleavage/methylation domain-containing protein [Desulfuromonas sp.]
MKLQKISNEDGYTLIELLTVITIIGILATIAIPNYMGYRDKAKMVVVTTTLRHVRLAQEVYFTDFQTYFSLQGGAIIEGSQIVPVTGTDLAIAIPRGQQWIISIPGDGTIQYTVVIQTDFDRNQNGLKDRYRYFKKASNSGETIAESDISPLLPIDGT